MRRITMKAVRLAAGAAAALACGQDAGPSAPTEAKELPGTIFVYCAAGVREPVQEIAKLFEAEAGVKVELSFANSGQLLAQIETTRTGDVYIPGDMGFVAKAEAKNLTTGRAQPFCYFLPAIYVRKGNPKAIREVNDLARPGVKLALADPSAAVGQLQTLVFKKNKLDEEALRKNTVASPAMVTEVALAVKMGTVDAGIIWDALGGFAPDDAEVVRIPLARNVIGVVAATVLASSRNPDAANAFLDCLTSDKGKAILKAKGHTVEKPAETLLVHVGGTMRPAMEEICALFEKEAGVKVELNYNDSGALMTVIQTTGKGDVCVVHDPFAAALDRKGLVDRIFTVASLTPTIVVKKGNPKKIAALKDLTRDGVRVALTDAEYSTGGHVVGVVFRKAGIAEAMEKKEIVRARSGGEVANAVKLGTVDAAIVWNAVAFERRDSLDAIPIDPRAMPDAKVDAVTSATYGVIDMSSIRVTLMTLKASRAPGAARALADFAMSDRGRAVFEKKGFSPAAIAPPATPPTDTPGAP